MFYRFKKKETLGVSVGEKNPGNLRYKMIMIDNSKYLFFFQKKCEKYWPDLLTESLFGKTKVLLLSENAYAYYVVRKMKVTSLEV